MKGEMKWQQRVQLLHYKTNLVNISKMLLLSIWQLWHIHHLHSVVVIGTKRKGIFLVEHKLASYTEDLIKMYSTNVASKSKVHKLNITPPLLIEVPVPIK